MEETWENQMASLQVNLLAPKKSLVVEDIAKQSEKPDPSSTLHYYDSDTTSMGTGTLGVGQQPNGSVNAVSHLVKEFEKQKHVFEDDAMFLVEVKSGQLDSTMNPEHELRKLEHRFEAWTKDYKVKLRETKVTLQQLGYTESDKKSKKWWG